MSACGNGGVKQGRGQLSDSGNGDRQLWQIGDIACVMLSCCAGAELQVRRLLATPDVDVLLRELYPTKSDLYERARDLKAEYERTQRSQT
jgi:hypothetical protein